MKDSLYEENFKLHKENARLRKNLEQSESSLGIDRLRAHFEAEIKKQLRREEKLKKEADRYHRLWQDAVSELRSKGDIIELLIQLEDLQKLCDQLREEISALTKENMDLKTNAGISFTRCIVTMRIPPCPPLQNPTIKRSKTAGSLLPEPPVHRRDIKDLIWSLQLFSPFLSLTVSSIIPITILPEKSSQNSWSTFLFPPTLRSIPLRNTGTVLPVPKAMLPSLPVWSMILIMVKISKLQLFF